MNKRMLLMALAALLVFPVVTYGETKEVKCEEKCLKSCSDKDDKSHADCMTYCMDQCLRDRFTGSYNLLPGPKSDLDSSKLCAEAGTTTKNTRVASVFDDKDQPCYVGGKLAAYCSRNNPYFNAFNNNCYQNLQECKKADGDFSGVEGSGGCVRCSK